MKRKFTQSEVDFIKTNYQLMTCTEMAKKLNRPLTSVYTRMYAEGLKKNTYNRYSKTEDTFIKANYTTLSDEEIGKKLNRTKQAITGRRKLLRLIKTPEMIQRKMTYKKGNIPHNAHKDGTITSRTESSGIEYLHMKVPGRRKMMMLHVYLWEQEHGQIPKTHVIVFKDGNQLNCVIENLKCITRAEHLKRNKQKSLDLENIIKDNPELLKLHQVTKKLKRKINKLKKSKK